MGFIDSSAYFPPITEWLPAARLSAQAHAAKGNISCPAKAAHFSCHLAPWGYQSRDQSEYMHCAPIYAPCEHPCCVNASDRLCNPRRERQFRGSPLHQPLGVHTKFDVCKGTGLSTARGLECLVGLFPGQGTYSRWGLCVR